MSDKIWPGAIKEARKVRNIPAYRRLETKGEANVTELVLFKRALKFLVTSDLFLQARTGIGLNRITLFLIIMIFGVLDDRQSFTLLVPLIHTFDKSGRLRYTTIRRELTRSQREVANKKREKEYWKEWRRVNPELARKEDCQKTTNKKKKCLGVIVAIIILILLLGSYPVIGLFLLFLSALAFIVYFYLNRKQVPDNPEHPDISREDRASEIWRIIHEGKLSGKEERALFEEYRSLVSNEIEK